jgi:hypothetical protein
LVAPALRHRFQPAAFPKTRSSELKPLNLRFAREIGNNRSAASNLPAGLVNFRQNSR